VNVRFGGGDTPYPLGQRSLPYTLKGTLGGVDALLTVRGMTPDEFQRNLTQVRGLLDAPISPQVGWNSSGPQASPPPASEEQRWCPKHGDKMQRNEKDGRSWYSHRHEGQWCKGK